MDWIHPKHQNDNNLLFEYYDKVSNEGDNDLLDNWEVWIYGNDRSEFPPHCHVRLPDGSAEFEVSLLNWEIVNIKHSELPNSWDSIDRNLKRGFFRWLDRQSKESSKLTNKEYLYGFWNGANPHNRLEKWIDKREGIDQDLINYIEHKFDYKRLSKDIIGTLSEIYFQDKAKRQELHSLSSQELLYAIGIDLDITSDETAQVVVQQAENNVYLWSTNMNKD